MQKPCALAHPLSALTDSPGASSDGHATRPAVGTVSTVICIVVRHVQQFMKLGGSLGWSDIIELISPAKLGEMGSFNQKVGQMSFISPRARLNDTLM